MELFLLCACCLFAVLVLWLRKGSKDDPPEISGSLPILGHNLRMLGGNIKNYQTIVEVSKECHEKGGVVTGYFGGRAYVLTDPEALLTISNNFLDKAYVYQFGRPFLGDGLITANGATWKKHRKILNPAFSQSILNSFIDIFNKQARCLVDQLASHLGKPYQLENILKMNNLQTVCLTSIGINDNDYKNLQQKYITLLPTVLQNMNERLCKIWLHSDFIYSLTSYKKVLNELLELSKTILQKKKAEMNDSNYERQNKGNAGFFLQMILDIAKKDKCLTDNEIREETDTIIVAGHETSSCMLNYALILLGSYPQVQEKVYNEILQVTGDSEKDIDKDDLSKLIYTEAVLKETMRLYPVMPVIARQLDKDIKIKNYTLKANSICALSIYGLNRHPVWGSDAEQFRPERWLDAETLPALNYFGTFGTGRRTCIGKVYAIMSMKITMAHVLRKYRVHSDVSKLVIKWNIMIYPAAGDHCTFELRN